uniref:Uncharacterized protein n=1 Tax=viral metagenome TaxID=1070528 RepID=A0A6C0BD01_9ZZZZ
MSSSARRSFDTDNITLRSVYAKGLSNTNIPSTLALTADGRGGTRWTHPSSLGVYCLNYISTDVSLISWDLSQNNIMYLTGGQGAGIQSSVRKTEAIVYAKAYQAFHDVNSGSNMRVLDGPPGVLYSTINLSTTSWQIYPTLCTTQQMIYLNTNPTKFLINSNVPTIDPSIIEDQYEELNIDNVNSTIRFLGVRDVHLSTINGDQKSVFFSISTFTSEGYLTLSGEVSSLTAMSTSMPYHYRDMITLTPSNSLFRTDGIPAALSTPYNGIFTLKYAGINPPTDSNFNFTSSIGWPYKPRGLSGSNVISTFMSTVVTDIERDYTVSVVESDLGVYSGDAFISSLTFNMSPYSTIIKRNVNASIVLNYTPSFLLTPNSTITGLSQNVLFGFSTFLNYGDTTVPGTTVEDLFIAPSQYPIQNPLLGRLQINIPSTFVATNWTSNYTVNHYFPSCIGGYSNSVANSWPATSYNYVRAGLSSAQITSYSSKYNTAYMTIIGE